MYVDRKEIFVNISADMLLKFQLHIEKHRFGALHLGPGLIFMQPLGLIICEATQKYSSTFEIIRRYS